MSHEIVLLRSSPRDQNINNCRADEVFTDHGGFVSVIITSVIFALGLPLVLL